jgi:hypothetical protein
MFTHWHYGPFGAEAENECDGVAKECDSYDSADACKSAGCRWE